MLTIFETELRHDIYRVCTGKQRNVRISFYVIVESTNTIYILGQTFSFLNPAQSAFYGFITFYHYSELQRKLCPCSKKCEYKNKMAWKKHGFIRSGMQ